MAELIASGRTADVFDAGPGRVLRRYRLDLSAVAEVETMRYLHGLGYPVPEVYDVDGPARVMQRVDGPTMLAALANGDLATGDGIRMLADLHTALHELPARTSTDPAERTLHLDLHPENVILTAGGPVVIDWADAIEGPPDFDLAVTAMIFAEVALFPGHPAQALARDGLGMFLDHAGVPPRPMVDRALAYRQGNPSLSADEHGRLVAAAALVHPPRVEA